ncbi:hypothetical protein GE09DRAFT_49660 [Coniochaeta sp. 2T2.1]|nr:hypothetical protein GE09DRAFT_49660 [Coniochaeta sp. 2T2.1]
MSSASPSSSASSSPAPFRSTSSGLFNNKHHPSAHLSTPQQRYKQQQQLARDKMLADKAAAAAERVRRDRMSRGKDPYDSAEDDVSEGNEQQRMSGVGAHQARGSPAGVRRRFGGAPEHEDFGKKERREKAVAFLDSPELLMMYAQSSGDSITGARLHFMKMMCGYDEETLEESREYYTGYNTGGMSGRSPRDTDKRRGGDRAAAAGR